MAPTTKGKASAPIHEHQRKVREWKAGGMKGPRPDGDPYKAVRDAERAKRGK